MNFERTLAPVQIPEEFLVSIPASDTHGAGEVAELDLSTLLIEAEEGGSGTLIFLDPERATDSQSGAVFIEIPAAVVRAVKARASKGAP